MFNRTQIQFILISFLIILFLTECKKDEEVDIPIITFIKPSENQYFVVGDTIPIEFEVTSISPIKSIQVTLVNDKLVPVTKNYSLNQLNGKTSGTIVFAMILEDLFMPIGNYEVKAQVINEKEVKDKYQKITISQTNRELLGVAVITKQPNIINVWNYDLYFQKSLKASMIGDYGGSVYNSFHNRMALSAKINGSFTIWDYLSGDTVYFEKTMANPPFPYYTGASKIDNFIVCPYYAGAFNMIDYQGDVVNSISTTANYYPENIFDVGDNFISIEHHKGSTQKRLVTHLGSTGMNYSYYILQGPVIKAFPFIANDFMMFSNYNGTGQIERFVWNSNSTTRPVTYAGDEFLDVVQINSKEYLILTANDVLWYRYETSSITSMISLSQTGVHKLRFDPISKTIWVVDNQGLSLYSYPTGNPISDIMVNEQVLNLHLIYNW
jgi:hypothetical protein